VDAATGGRIAALLTRGDLSGKIGENVLVTDLTGTKPRAPLTVLAKKEFLRRPGGARAARPSPRSHARVSQAWALAVARPGAKELDDYYSGGPAAELTGAALYQVNDL